MTYACTVTILKGNDVNAKNIDEPSFFWSTRLSVSGRNLSLHNTALLAKSCNYENKHSSISSIRYDSLLLVANDSPIN